MWFRWIFLLVVILFLERCKETSLSASMRNVMCATVDDVIQDWENGEKPSKTTPSEAQLLQDPRGWDQDSESEMIESVCVYHLRVKWTVFHLVS
ncbi:hypothetical protein DFH28DRAFT_294900 [Melampsora americana]|nr:hypothetical protein DFH28DRAFT_294900 [Melampsora americana]